MIKSLFKDTKSNQSERTGGQDRRKLIRNQMECLSGEGLFLETSGAMAFSCCCYS